MSIVAVSSVAAEAPLNVRSIIAVPEPEIDMIPLAPPAVNTKFE